MNRITRIILPVSVSLLLPLALVGSAFAYEQTTPTTQTTAPPQEAPVSPAQNQELLKRIETRKAEAKLKLTTAQQKRIETRCQGAQGLVKQVSGRAHGVETSRTKVHTNLVERLKKLEAKLTEKNLDTTQYKTQITELESKIATFNTDMAAYKLTVTDLSSIEDCTADPTAFKASLDASRTALQKVRDDSLAIRTYVKDTIKPTLKSLRTQLETTANQETN